MSQSSQNFTQILFLLSINRNMSPISSILKTAAATTIRGAGITLASTCASCYFACQIEIGAHRLVYHYFPEKYADVEYANGLTQEQLEAVRIIKTEQKPVTTSEEEYSTLPVPTHLSKKISDLQQDDSVENKFWKEENLSLASLSEQFIMPSQAIIACSMTA